MWDGGSWRVSDLGGEGWVSIGEGADGEYVGSFADDGRMGRFGDPRGEGDGVRVGDIWGYTGTEAGSEG